VQDSTRHSKAEEAELITDPEELASREVRNGLKQFDQVVEMIEYHLDPERPFKLRPSAFLNLHRTALDGISLYAGNFRPSNIEIGKSKHEPPPAHRVPELVEDLCDYVNSGWQERSALHLAAYVLWRLNWIHPFTDGNGRTSRVLSYLVLNLRLKTLLPGSHDTIPQQISENKTPYYHALEMADESLRAGALDLSAMEDLLSAMLARQLYSVHREASGA
jgi:Fic family protein